MLDESENWGLAMRALRAHRPESARRGARASTYGAGLQQAEQLWGASEVVGTATSPLLLFYGLTQAGRALCAAAGQSEGANGHGLKFVVERPPSRSPVNLSHVVVKPHGQGLIQQVAEVLSSPVLSKPVALSSLIASLEVPLAFEADKLDAATALQVASGDDGSENPYKTPATGELIIWPLPAGFAAETELVPAGPHNLEYIRRLPPSLDEVVEWLAPYPRLTALGDPEQVESWSGPEESLAVRVRWDVLQSERKTQIEWVRSVLDVVEDNPVQLSGSVLPAVGGNSSAQHPLVAWWLTLYALSMLARYYPGLWRATLDLDESTLAVPLDHLIKMARSTVPLLLFEAFRDRMPQAD